MGWDKGGRYYTRSRKVNGKVVREYVGGGDFGRLAALIDADGRALREEERQIRRAERDRYNTLERTLDDLDRLTDLVAEAALLAAGYRRHNRGEWRKRRVRH
jgi:hypothetical protein